MPARSSPPQTPESDNAGAAWSSPAASSPAVREPPGALVGSSSATASRRIYDDVDAAGGKLPKLHQFSYRGDLQGVLGCITDGHSVHDTVTMRNQAGRLVCGITPLFLAAQKGHLKLCKLLVSNGANPAQPAYIQGSADLCTPLQVARLNLHIRVSMYLKKAEDARKAEDRVLKEEEEGHARSAAEPDAGRGAQHVVMANLGDLSGWDPHSGTPPPLQTGNLLARMLKRNKVDLMAWRPDVERTNDGEEQMMASANRVVDPSELEHLEVADHTSALNSFLQDADLAQWNPAVEEEAAYSTRGGAAASSSIAATGRRSFDGGDNVPASAGGARSDVSNSRAASPSPHQQQHQVHAQSLAASAHVAQQQHARAAAAAAAAAAMSRPSQGGKSATSASAGGAGGWPPRAPAARQPQAPPGAPAARSAGPSGSRRPATRWYAHGGSDSEDDEEDDLEASASVPAAAPVHA